VKKFKDGFINVQYFKEFGISLFKIELSAIGIHE
jgi:hypothetical protein